MPTRNEFGQPVGDPLPLWRSGSAPTRESFSGKFVRLEPIDPLGHSRDLLSAYSLDETGQDWTYLPIEKPEDEETIWNWLTQNANSLDPFFFAIIDLSTQKPVGIASYLRMQPNVGVIEVGYITFSPLLKNTRMSTEAMFLMMARAFDTWGYRRYEWKCDNLNAPSRNAAKRLGFTFEGVFRQASVTKGRNRDTAWFSILDTEWPIIKKSFEIWLMDTNFDVNGAQIERLADIRDRLCENAARPE